MQEQFDILDMSQQNFIKMLDSLSLEQINKIPQGHNNNLIWNFAHIVAVLQLLCYSRAGLALPLDDHFVMMYKAGTKPESPVTAEQYATIKVYASEGLNKLKADYKAGIFKAFKPYKTLTGIEINTVEFATTYVVHHHGIHTGAAAAIKKLVI
jgi:hypothetical protein